MFAPITVSCQVGVDLCPEQLRDLTIICSEFQCGDTNTDCELQVWYQAAPLPADSECTNMDESQPNATASEPGVCD